MAEGLSDYLRAIGRVPMLSADEQIMLGTSVRRWLDDPEPTPAAIRRGKRAKDRMVQANLRLVVSWAKRYQNKGVGLDDLVQEGNLGLIRAVEKYDPSTGYRFSTYATWWIRQGLSKAITDKSSTIRRAGSAQQGECSDRRVFEGARSAAVYGRDCGGAGGAGEVFRGDVVEPVDGGEPDEPGCAGELFRVGFELRRVDP
jgi:hypothetical protein